MEKTQTDPWPIQRRNERDLTARTCAAAPLALSYLTPEAFETHQIACKGRLMGAVAFGAQRPRVTEPDCPYAWVEMPVLNGACMIEVWTCAQPVVREVVHELSSTRNDHILFGCLQIELDCGLEAASYQAYSRIFDFIDALGYRHLLRMWNYFPRINAGTDGLERYVSFNVGRHEAFVAKGRVIGTDTPAACALGSRGNRLVIYFLAAKQAGQRLENPRQTSAFHYPAQYGPRSPTFARAMLMQTTGEPCLFVSGTASIVGHETLHIGNAAAQIQETISNILAVVTQAQRAGMDCSSKNSRLSLKTYLRRPEDLTMARNCLLQAFGSLAHTLYLQADICRSNLLLEVEAAYLNTSTP